MGDCIFCKIIDGKIPSAKVHEDAEFICIKDIQPQAKTHLLVIPKRHIASLDAVFAPGTDGGATLVGKLMETGTRIAREQGLLPGGFRSVINTGVQGGQTVFHLHLHLLGGESLNGRFG